MFCFSYRGSLQKWEAVHFRPDLNLAGMSGGDSG